MPIHLTQPVEEPQKRAHTDGKWISVPRRFSANSSFWVISTDETANRGVAIAEVIGDDAEKNVALIATAPDLLIALKSMLAVIERSFEPSQTHLDNTGWVEGRALKAAAEIARTAIARAEGV